MWPSENPWPAILLCLILATAFFIVWTRQRKVWPLAAIAVLLALSVGAWCYDRAVVTQREEITDDVRAIVHAFQQRDLEGTLFYISDSARDLKLMAGNAYNLVTLGDDTRVTDIQVEMLAQGDRAKARFRVNGTLGYNGAGQHISTLWEAKWQPEESGWKMIDIAQFDPVTGRQDNLPNEWRQHVLTTYPR